MKIFLKCTDCRGLLIYEPCVFPVSVMRMTPPDAWKVLYLLNFQKEKKKKKKHPSESQAGSSAVLSGSYFWASRSLPLWMCRSAHATENSAAQQIPLLSRNHCCLERGLEITEVAAGSSAESLEWPEPHLQNASHALVLLRKG